MVTVYVTGDTTPTNWVTDDTTSTTEPTDCTSIHFNEHDYTVTRIVDYGEKEEYDVEEYWEYYERMQEIKEGWHKRIKQYGIIKLRPTLRLRGVRIDGRGWL